MPEQARQLRAIVFSDVVDSSLKIFADELIAIQRIKEDLHLIRDQVQIYGGQLVKSLGNGLLVTFDAPTQALRFIQAAVQALRQRGRQSLTHRFGLHTGEIYADGDDIIGQGVHLASRPQTVSPPNGVAFTRSTYDLIDPRFRQLAHGMGAVELKGLPERMDLYSLGPEELLRFGETSQAGGINVDALLKDTPYSVVRTLSRASTRNTLLLQERQRDRQVVLKLIPADAELEHTLRVEAARLDRLRHPRIPRVVDVYAQSGIFCFIQEHIAGPSMQGSLDLLRRKQQLATLLRQVLQVLEVVHAAGLVHGDIHPANLISPDSDRAPFLVDFSLLKARTEVERPSLETSSLSLSERGRPYFTAPERVRFGRITPSTDLYALGVSALLLHTGQDPSQLYDETLARWTLDSLDPEVQHWLAPLLEDQPARRVQRASDALQLLDQPAAFSPAGPAVTSASAASPLDAQAPPSSASLPPLGVDPVPVISKTAFHDQLVETYGPMVALLLEAAPALVPPESLLALRQKLVQAGLAVDDVDAAIRVAADAVPSAPAAGEPDPEVPAAIAPSAAADLSKTPPVDGLAVLRNRLGPIADMLWTPDLASLRSRLQAASVPAAVVDELLDALAALPEASPPAVHPTPDPSLPLPPETDADPPAPANEDQLQAHLTDLIGPIGLTVLAQVQDRRPEERPAALLEALQGYGVDRAVLDTLAERIGLG